MPSYSSSGNGAIRLACDFSLRRPVCTIFVGLVILCLQDTSNLCYNGCMQTTALDRLSDMEFCAIIAQSTSINDARKRIGGKNSQQAQDRIRERIQRLQI